VHQGANVLKKRREDKKNTGQRAQIKWLPQKRQLTFLKACGLSFPFRYYIDENKEGLPKIFKRPDEEMPDGIHEPKAKVIGYGGAAGGGKSDALLMSLFAGILANPGAKCGFFRREYPQLEGSGGAIMRSKEIFTDFPGAKWNGTQRAWTFTSLNNGLITFNHLKQEDDIYNYQSQQFDYIAFDEATQFLRKQYRYLVTRLRATVKGVFPIFMLATNPGNIGHAWFKKEFIEIGPPEEPHTVMVEQDPPRYEKHIFIPAYLDDNIILEDRDPSYRSNLENQDEVTRKRLLRGNWDIHSGQFFPKFSRAIHVVEPIEIPHYWKRFITVDYGLDMAAVYWIALSDMGFYYVYRELHQPNIALSDLADRILERMKPPEREMINYIVIPPDLFNTRKQETGKSGRQILVENGLSGYGMRMADNRRVEGWRVMREYLKPIDDPFHDGDGEPDKVARLLFFRGHVPKIISHIPMLQHAELDANDVENEPHHITHGPDSIRYFLMSRPPLKSLTDKQKEKIWKQRRKKTEPLYEETGY